jgi:predicted alpha/beta-fold hydrolase
LTNILHVKSMVTKLRVRSQNFLRIYYSDDYYKEQSCIVNLQNVAIPLFVINAKDDPLVIGDMIPLQAPLENRNLILVTTEHGGNGKK